MSPVCVAQKQKSQQGESISDNPAGFYLEVPFREAAYSSRKFTSTFAMTGTG
jgi:hypothetical protein